MRRASPLIVAALLAALCPQARAAEPVELVFVRDLADVAGCQFLGPVRLPPGPPGPPGSRLPGGPEVYRTGAPRPPELRGATHLYVVNPSAVWGGAAAFGAAYQCQPRGLASRLGW